MMRKSAIFLTGMMAVLCGCAKHDPILPGVRNSIFATSAPVALNQTIADLPATAVTSDADAVCPYTQDASNVIKNGDRKIFSGFPTPNSVRSDMKPICSGKYVYAGLTTGEVIKVDTKTRNIAWIADVFRPSNMTGGASVIDIVAPIMLHNGTVYAGGLGDAFCAINATSGVKKWCAYIGTAHPFIITDAAAFVVGTDDNLYAVRMRDGAIYWRAAVNAQSAPTYGDGTVTVGRQKFDAATGQKK